MFTSCFSGFTDLVNVYKQPFKTAKINQYIYVCIVYHGAVKLKLRVTTKPSNTTSKAWKLGLTSEVYALMRPSATSCAKYP